MVGSFAKVKLLLRDRSSPPRAWCRSRLPAKPAGEVVGVFEACPRGRVGNAGRTAQRFLGGFEPQPIPQCAQTEAGLAFQLSREMVGVVAGGPSDVVERGGHSQQIAYFFEGAGLARCRGGGGRLLE